MARREADFDPGAKYHVAANVPYTRYFLADILQFQFHRALSQTAGCTAPLNRCSIFGNKAAGERLNAMLEMGQSRPWQEALEKIAGTREMDASAIRDYFAPLQKWLDEQNRGNSDRLVACLTIQPRGHGAGTIVCDLQLKVETQAFNRIVSPGE